MRQILQAHIPHLAVRVFGSRARGGAKLHSVLDLVVMTAEPLPMSIKVGLENAFSESCLPFKVDVLYWDELGGNFRQLIDGASDFIHKPQSSPRPSRQSS